MDIISILQESEAMLSGHFLLSSGCHSDKYFQCAKLLQYPDKASLVLSVPVQEILAEKNAEKIDFDAVVGPAMGGIIPAYEFARQLGIPAFFTERNEDGDMVLRRGFEIKEGMKILLAEDVITTGRSTLESAKVLQDLGAKIVASICIVDRRDENAENPFSWPIFSALRSPTLNFEPTNCPLCDAGEIPLVKPGSRKKI
ncbi:MAG TPA: orotate phosphoribosyltransferase [Treponemataceae bacterium]|nr:orotate phosphoribosyltransferase [Treponemataceae bacterium]